MMDLVPAFQGVEKFGDEAKQELEAFMTGMGLGAKELVFAILAKPVVPTA
jgi:hypothetical protein